MAAKLILAERPDLASGADLKYLGGRDGALKGRMKSLFRKVG
jgi:hypothetical protein